jgi:hypothetical protein
MLAGLSRPLWYAFAHTFIKLPLTKSLPRSKCEFWGHSLKEKALNSLFRQHDSMFRNVNGLEEVSIIVPFRLYITHYTPSPLCTNGGINRPTIHVEGCAFTGPTVHLEGEIGGAVWESDKDTRAMWGTVSTCADGSIRWCMVRRTPSSVRLPHVLILPPLAFGSIPRQRTTRMRRSGYLRVSKWALSDRELALWDVDWREAFDRRSDRWAAFSGHLPLLIY